MIFPWKLPCLPVAQGITILILWRENWIYVEASNNWFSLDDNISFHYKARTFQNAEAQLVFFEQESWCFKFLEPSEHFEIDHVLFFMLNWIIQRNATNEKASLSSLQVWCDLHDNDQAQPDYNLLGFIPYTPKDDICLL